MKILDIVNRVNRALAGELLSYSQMKDHLDDVIDDINNQLDTIYPAFSELDPSLDSYTAFDDRYIRSVVIPGAAYYFYQMDEEGIDTAPAYAQKYQRNLFLMIRDTINNIPEQYKRGYVDPATLGEGEVAPEVPVAGVIHIEEDGDLEMQGGGYIHGSIWR